MARRCLVGVVSVVFAVGVVGASACSSGSGSSRVTDVPRRGGVLRIGLTRPATLDPALAKTTEQLLLADQLFDSLTAYDPSTLAPVPSLAASWKASADQKQWAFTFQSGA